MTPRARAALPVLLTAVVGLGALSIDMSLPSLPAMAAVFRAAAATTQLTVTLFLVGLAAAQMIFGPLSDRVGRRPVLLAGLTLYSLAGLACYVAPSIRILITARVVLNETRTDKVLWEDDHFLFKRQYDVAETSVTFVDQETIAIDEVATDFARSVVTSILEGF